MSLHHRSGLRRRQSGNQRRNSRGVSLVEALVAMAIMAFGLVGMVGVQSTLRGNSDTARQRAEALKLAQARVETARHFSVIATPAGPPPSATSFDSIVGAPAAAVAGENTTFTVTETVTDSSVATPSHPRTKTLNVDVRWTDRTGAEQRVRLSSLLSATPPALRGSLSMPAEGSLAQRRQGRNLRIPVAAIDLGNGSSQFTPPGAAGNVSWTFNNTTAVITQICDFAGVCVATNARLLSGFVRFATLAPPAAGVGINPPGALIAGIGVSVNATVPAPAFGDCYTQEFPVAAYTQYFCAIPLGVAGVEWSGQSTLTGLALAASIADPSAALLRVCRYTTLRSQAVVPVIKNEEHPFDYFEVKNALSNQNFLIIQAGNGITAFDCPEGLPVPPPIPVPGAPSPLGRTWHHQPAV